jgi:hypothetical protein
LRKVTAERSGAAGRNGSHRPVLHRDECVSRAIRSTMALEDFGQLDLDPGRIRLVRMRAHGPR